MLCVPAPVVNSLRLQAVVAAIGPPCGMHGLGRSDKPPPSSENVLVKRRPDRFYCLRGRMPPNPPVFRTRSHQECKLAELTKP
jgi:hypothetical protein